MNEDLYVAHTETGSLPECVADWAILFGISPLWFRLAFLIALIPGGIPGLLVYLILWLIIPSEA